MRRNTKSKLLIVDDNLKNLQILGNMLYSAGYRISVAKDGPQALQLVAKNTPDLLLLDIMMPGMDGYEVCKRLKSNPDTENIPVIFLTALTGLEDLVKGFESGGVDYITKPFKREELLARIQTHLELKKSRETILHQTEELEKLNSTKDKLFSIIAHDLRGPMASLEGALVTLRENPEFFKEHLDDLIFMVSHTKQLVENLLNWSRNQQKVLSIHPKLFDLGSLIKDTIDLFKTGASKKGITLDWEQSSQIKAFGDPDMIRTVLLNLISNAIKFTPPAGIIRVNGEKLGDLVRVTITDTGIGISSEDIEKILNPNSYHSTYGTQNEKGSGLGINLSRDFVEQNQGKLSIESTPEKGSSVSFTIPSGEKAISIIN